MRFHRIMVLVLWHQITVQTIFLCLTHRWHKRLKARLWNCRCTSASGSVWRHRWQLQLRLYIWTDRFKLFLDVTWPHRADDVFEGMKPWQHREDLLCAICYLSELRVKNNWFYSNISHAARFTLQFLLLVASLGGLLLVSGQCVGRKSWFTGHESSGHWAAFISCCNESRTGSLSCII